MAVISNKFNYLYLAAPGAASTTTSDYLLEYCDGRWIPEDDIADEQGYYIVQKKHSTISDLLEYNLLSPEELELLFKFTTVRNPFERLFSEWNRSRVKWLKAMKNPNSWIYKSPNKLRRIIETIENDFSDWIELRYGKSYEEGQKLQVFEKYIEGVDHIIKVEELEKELKIVLQNLGAKIDANLISKNVTPGKDKPYWQYYDYRAREIVSSVFEPELENFGYNF